jgi:hypothetical protein
MNLFIVLKNIILLTLKNINECKFDQNYLKNITKNDFIYASLSDFLYHSGPKLCFF